MRLWIMALVALVVSTGAAFADPMKWNIRAFDKYAVDVTFYSQNRKAAWPGNGQVWTIRDYKVHSFSLNCIAGEKICYGGWVRGNDKKYWGVGHNNAHRCTGCCYTCGSTVETPVVNLNE